MQRRLRTSKRLLALHNSLDVFLLLSLLGKLAAASPCSIVILVTQPAAP